MPTVVLYGRPECHLCNEARAALVRLRDGDGGFELEEVDIESDDGLFARLLERIPVVEIDGRVVSELELDIGAVETTLVSARGR